MESKIQELTEKLYSEGVEKGEKEAQRIIEEAQNCKKRIIEEAEDEAKNIVHHAIKQTEELKRNTYSEIKLCATQTVEALRMEIANLLTNKLAQTHVGSAFSNKEFMPQLILKLVEEWYKKEQLTISLKDSIQLKDFFIANAKELLDNGIRIEEISGKKHSFTITPNDGSYKINFGEDEFIEYFKEFLRPQLTDLLF